MIYNLLLSNERHLTDRQPSEQRHNFNYLDDEHPSLVKWKIRNELSVERIANLTPQLLRKHLSKIHISPNNETNDGSINERNHGDLSKFQLAPGDIIFHVNGIPTKNLSAEKVEELLNDYFASKSPQLLRIGVRKRKSTYNPSNSLSSLRSNNRRSPITGMDRDMSVNSMDFNQLPVQGQRRTVRLNLKNKDPLGIKIAGGNQSGIYITNVNKNSLSDRSGIVAGDRIDAIGNESMDNRTKEEVIHLLVNSEYRTQNQNKFIDLTLYHDSENYQSILRTNEGDSFFIRTHFDYMPIQSNPKQRNNYPFVRGSIFHVIDTLCDDENKRNKCWTVKKIFDPKDLLVNSSEMSRFQGQRGTIPNFTYAEEIFNERNVKRGNRLANTPQQSSCGSIFSSRKRSKSTTNYLDDPTIISSEFQQNNRNKSQSMNQLNNTSNLKNSSMYSLNMLPPKFPVYERVVLQELNFRRPVIIYGTLANNAIQHLLNDFPQHFQMSTTQPHNSLNIDYIKESIDAHKHCILEVSPNAIEYLNYRRYYPIVIFLKTTNQKELKKIIIEHDRLLNLRMPESHVKTSSKQMKKLWNQMEEYSKYWYHTFTAVIGPLTLQNENIKGEFWWYQKIKEVIETQQQTPTWITDRSFIDPSDYHKSSTTMLNETDGNMQYERKDDDFEDELPQGQIVNKFPSTHSDYSNSRRETDEGFLSSSPTDRSPPSSNKNISVNVPLRLNHDSSRLSGSKLYESLQNHLKPTTTSSSLISDKNYQDIAASKFMRDDNYQLNKYSIHQKSQHHNDDNSTSRNILGNPDRRESDGSHSSSSTDRFRNMTHEERIATINERKHEKKKEENYETVRGVFDHTGGILEKNGVQLRIPSGAIPVDKEQEIYFQLCDKPQFDYEEEQLLSPLVVCGPIGVRFLKPVELILPHWAPREDVQSLSVKLNSLNMKSGENVSTQYVGDTRTDTEKVSIMIDYF
ncbi:hypothetical protein SNEBB_000902 [Seison nebaliae]|nr:hypothetical protein SNEBB_000902 [Seison nebaliae]